MYYAALIVLISLAATQAKPAPAPKRELAVPFAAGEALTYDISWSTFLTAGSATVSVKEKKPSYGSTAYYIVAEGRPTPLLSKLYALYYKADTLLDVYTLLPQRGSIYSDENGRKRLFRIDDQEFWSLVQARRIDPPHHRRHEVQMASIGP